MTQTPETQPYDFLIHRKRDREQVWRDKVVAVAAHVNMFGRFPRAVASDDEEKRLGVFLSTQRSQASGSKYAHMLTPARRAYLDGHVPGWLLDHEQAWRANVHAVTAHFALQGRFPSSAATDGDGKRLGEFLKSQRGQARGGKYSHLLTPERRTFLDEHLPGWLLDPEQGWRDRVIAVAAHVAMHDRFPSSTGANADEKRLGVFLSTQRTQANGGEYAHLLTPERGAFLDEHLPGWLPDHEQAWRDKVLAVAGHVAVHGKTPSQKATDSDEKRLGVFLSNQRMQANGGKSAHLLTPERRAFLDEHVPGWSSTRR